MFVSLMAQLGHDCTGMSREEILRVPIMKELKEADSSKEASMNKLSPDDEGLRTFSIDMLLKVKQSDLAEMTF